MPSGAGIAFTLLSLTFAWLLWQGRGSDWGGDVEPKWRLRLRSIIPPALLAALIPSGCASERFDSLRLYANGMTVTERAVQGGRPQVVQAPGCEAYFRPGDHPVFIIGRARACVDLVVQDPAGAALDGAVVRLDHPPGGEPMLRLSTIAGEGGLLVAASWRWIFLINVPIGVILLWTAARTVPESRDPHPAPVDGAGAVLLAFGVGAVSLALVQGPEWGWTHPATLAAAILGVLALVWFARRTMRHDSPLLDPALLRVRPFAWSNVTAIAFSASFAAGLLVNILWMQNQWGYSALRTGLAVAPGPMLVPLFAVIGQLLSRRIPSGTVAALGSALWGAGIVLVLAGVDATPNYAAGMLPGWIVGGAGVGLALPTILATAAATLPPALGATGSAVVNTARQLGSVLGIAILVALLASSGFTAAWWAVAALAPVGAVTPVGQ